MLSAHTTLLINEAAQLNMAGKINCLVKAAFETGRLSECYFDLLQGRHAAVPGWSGSHAGVQNNLTRCENHRKAAQLSVQTRFAAKHQNCSLLLPMTISTVISALSTATVPP